MLLNDYINKVKIMECNLSEILGALSLATDLADGHPSGSAMGSAVIATNIGKATTKIITK